MVVFRNPPAAQTSNTESILARYFLRIPNPQPEIREILDPEKLLMTPSQREPLLRREPVLHKELEYKVEKSRDKK